MVAGLVVLGRKEGVLSGRKAAGCFWCGLVVGPGGRHFLHGDCRSTLSQWAGCSPGFSAVECHAPGCTSDVAAGRSVQCWKTEEVRAAVLYLDFLDREGQKVRMSMKGPEVVDADV